MKRPTEIGPAKRTKSKRVPLDNPLDDLKERLERSGLDATFNSGVDEVSLDELYVLLVDMIAALVVHGAKPDEAFGKVKPGEVWRQYVSLWREQYLRCEQITRKYSEDSDDVFYHADEMAAQLERRERIAWRLFLCQQELAPELSDETLRSQLEAVRVAKPAPRKRAA